MNNTDADYEDIAEPKMRAEYDFTRGQRGRHAHVFPRTARAVVLAPDMAAVFPDADSVNEALRMLVKAARQSIQSETSAAPTPNPDAPHVSPPVA